MMKTNIEQGICLYYDNEFILITAIEAFLIDRKAQNLTAGTLHFYRVKLLLLSRFCEGQAITRIDQITAQTIRRFLLWLEETGHNPGGIHAVYRAIRTLFTWFEGEYDPPGWLNPIKRVKSPKVAHEVITGVDTETLRKMLSTCQGKGFNDLRDKAILLALLDTGARAAEFCAMGLADLNLSTGAILVRQGKGRKPRSVFLGRKARHSLRVYLKQRQDDSPALWVTDGGDRLSYSGLRQVVRRRAVKVCIKPPALHDFRRAFALSMLRAGTDVFTIQKLMGHSNLDVLRRYLAQDDRDIMSAHAQNSPADMV